LYGGGNNLEPGQRYYVSIRCKGHFDVWSPYDILGFIMPHFENYYTNPVSSSSSSSNSIRNIDVVYYLTPDGVLDLGTFDIVAVDFSGSPGESGQIILGATTVTVRNSSGNLLFAPGELYEHEFTSVGETYVASIGGNSYSITLVLDSDLVFVISLGI